jgi:hypothetical protein
MADMLSDGGIAPMHSTTIAKIEAGSRSVRINEAVGIADLFEVSLDSLLDRKSGASPTELAYRLPVLRDNTAKSAGQVAGLMQRIREDLEGLPGEFDGADELTETADNALTKYLEPAVKALLELSFVSERILRRERERLETSEEVPTELGGPQDGETQS